MKYSDETIEAVSDSTGLSEGQLRYIYIFRELESTDEQKALRAAWSTLEKLCADYPDIGESLIRWQQKHLEKTRS